jgi:hypothetical protein
MDAVRKKGTGTWDITQNRWELKKLGIRMTPKQLADALGEPVPEGKIASRPFWDKYLAAFQRADTAKKRQRSHLQERLRSLDIIIESLEAESRDATAFKKEREYVLSVPEWDIDHADFPAIHPDAKSELSLLGLDENDELAVRVLNSHYLKKAPVKGGVKQEADRYIDTKKGKDKSNQRAAIDLFTQACGNILVTEITIDHYRKFFALLKKQDNWNDTSKAKNQGRVHTFLHALETDHNHPMPWIGDKRHMLEVPEGDKVQYTIEQVRTALANATGVARTALLLGLNCGFTKADIGELVEQEHVIDGGTHISKVRSKLKHKKTKVKPVWWLWPETAAALQFGLTSRDVDREYTKFRMKFNLPEHKALRKTTAQVIEDHVGESESLLFRGESKGGTHYKHYIKKYTPEQVAKLDAALKTARKVLFGVE